MKPEKIMNTRKTRTASWRTGLIALLFVLLLPVVPGSWNVAPGPGAGPETAAVLLAGPDKDTPKYKRVSWRTLRLYIPGHKPPDKVAELDGQKIEIIGFLAALTQLEDMEEFVLSVTPPMNCYCHPAMRVNEALYVKMKDGETIDYKAGLVKLRGTLKVTMDIKYEYDDVMYTLECDEVL